MLKPYIIIHLLNSKTYIELTMSAPIGNQNARKAREWKDALKYALDTFEGGAIERGKALREIATRLIEKALAGDLQAIKEIGDRLDGKPTQAVGEGDGPVEARINLTFVDSDHGKTDKIVNV